MLLVICLEIAFQFDQNAVTHIIVRNFIQMQQLFQNSLYLELNSLKNHLLRPNHLKLPVCFLDDKEKNNPMCLEKIWSS